MLDLGSGAGADVLISARRVGAHRQGHRPRHDRRDARPRPRQRRPRPASTNVEFVKGYIEDIPLPDETVDVVHLQLRDQPLRRQAAGPARSRPRPAPRRTLRRLRRHRRPRHGRGHPRRHGPMDRLHRRRPHPRRVRARPRRRRPDRHRDHRDPPRPRARRPRRSSAPASPSDRCFSGWDPGSTSSIVTRTRGNSKRSDGERPSRSASAAPSSNISRILMPRSSRKLSPAPITILSPA